MRVSPLPGGHTGEHVREVLNDLAIEASNMHHAGGHACDLFNSYLDFAAKAASTLSYYLRVSDVDRLICTRRFWALQATDPSTRSGPALAGLVHAEGHAVTERLEHAAKTLDDDLARWNQRAGILVVLDTNVYCRRPQVFDETDWNEVLATPEAVHVVMPMVFVDELDRLKRHHEVKGRARATLHAIDRWIDTPDAVASIRPPSAKRAFTFELLVEELGHTRMARADDEIIDRAADLSAIVGKPVSLVTYDTGARIRGRLAGLHVRQIDDP
jgi:hypothetical protein